MTKMLQGVVDFGTGGSLRWAYGVKGQVAGKTGTTNDNADGWFIGFSPQLLSGVWVGCDDPFLRLLYTSGGAQMAMPAWAYYYQQVFNDKSLNIDPEAAFIPPPNMQNEIIFDYQDANQNELLPAEGDEGFQTDEYIEIPISDGKEKVVSESKKFEETTVPKETPKKEMPKPIQVKENEINTNEKDTASKKRGLLKRVFGKKDQ
jgi:penicillin-binding protein 1A